ncbi:UDP-glucose 4-epimerase GalE [Acuticoccus sp. M5D2P5]|uniref:UDP-glucose 4-epimerase GalE n=1 Tax=Acuticoccus kalidii TaxID=2910977 RepID=UPI001F30A1EF|nr:UDP-glucose 4-epimerase GalE [Acuticoccus kalidii]MCF3936070.1 UDP-glucose 4-epimerase GalE [Acuticoccus kalidii]
MDSIIVTGGAGYIGSHVAKSLAAAGYRPVVFDNLATGNRWAVRWGPFEKGDLLDADRLDAVFAAHRPKGIVHLAALSDVAASFEETDAYLAVNVTGTRHLIEAAMRHGAPPIVFSSTCSVYGIPDWLPIREGAPKVPINPYGETKLAAEALLEEAARGGLPSIALRYFNVAGADPDGEIGEARQVETHLIPRLFQSVTGDGDPIRIMGTDYPTPDGTAIRDYVHVSDLADVHLEALAQLRQGHGGGAYNFGSGKGHSVREVVDAVERVTGMTVPTILAPRRAGDPPALYTDAEAAHAAFGADSTRRSDIDTIVETAWRWHRQWAASASGAVRRDVATILPSENS